MDISTFVYRSVKLSMVYKDMFDVVKNFRYILFLGICLYLQGIQTCFSQTHEAFTSYFQTQATWNPAATSAGMDYGMLRTSHIRQWSGIKGAPAGSQIQVDCPSYILNGAESEGSFHGLGVQASAFQSGVLGLKTLFMQYAYHLKVSDESYVSMGASLGFINAGIQEDNVVLDNENDNLITNGYSFWKPESQWGMMYYTPDFRWGISIQNLFQSSFNWNPSPYKGRGLQSYLSKQWILSEELALETGGMCTFSSSQPIQLRSHLLIGYRNIVRTGLIFNTLGSIGWAASCTPINKLHISYFMDVFPAGSSKIGLLSHEILIAIPFGSSDQSAFSLY